MTPFHDPPRRIFLKRHSRAGLIAFGVGILAVVLFANAPAFQPKVSESFFEFYANLFKDLLHPPEVCTTGDLSDKVEIVLCGDFWSQLELRGLLGSAPIGLWLVYLGFGYTLFRNLYKAAEKKMSTGAAIQSGIATSPVEAESDLFSWFFCLFPIGVQMPDSTQAKVYLPLESPTPKPGDTVAIYRKHPFAGSTYLIGSAHLPHVTVMSGGKKSRF
jgi:hypothetical protein